jgi:hypothetical protein
MVVVQQDSRHFNFYLDVKMIKLTRGQTYTFVLDEATPTFSFNDNSINYERNVYKCGDLHSQVIFKIEGSDITKLERFDMTPLYLPAQYSMTRKPKTIVIYVDKTSLYPKYDMDFTWD